MPIDIDKFRASVLKEDLGRTNLFQVILPQKIGKSGAASASSGGKSILRSITDAVTKEVLAKYEPARRLTGFFSPEVIRAVGLGDMLDAYLQYPYELGMYVRSISLPGRDLETSVTTQDQVNHSIVTGGSFEPITMTFIMTPSQKERQFFLDWMNRAHNMDNNKFGFYDDYVSNITVNYLNRRGDIISVCEIAEAFPISVSQLALSYEDNNELASFDVTFAYKKAVTKQSSEKGDRNVFGEIKHWYEVGKRLITTYKN